MAKTLFCFICKKIVEVHADEAIAALCTKHKTDENLDIMSNQTTTRRLLAIQDEGLKLWVQDNQDATKLDMDNILKAIVDLKTRIEALPSEIVVQEPAPNTLTGGTVNEFGEVV